MMNDRCDLCGVNYTSSENKDDHEKGRRHLRKVKEQRRNMSVEAEAEATNSNASLDDQFQRLSVGGEALAPQAPLQPSLQQPARQPQPPPQPLPSVNINFNVSTGGADGSVVQYGSAPNSQHTVSASSTPADGNASTGQIVCDVCNIPCNSRVSYEQHLEGAAHRKKVKQMGGDEPTGDISAELPAGASSDVRLAADQSFYCKFCDKPCNSQKTWDQHVTSQKHLRKVESRKEPITGDLISLEDQQGRDPVSREPSQACAPVGNKVMDFYTLNMELSAIIDRNNGLNIFKEVLFAAKFMEYGERFKQDDDSSLAVLARLGRLQKLTEKKVDSLLRVIATARDTRKHERWWQEMHDVLTDYERTIPRSTQ